MPTDYNQIRADNILLYGTGTAHLARLGDLYSDRTHFIFELLQNAEDAKASAVQFRLGASGLELSHDGRLFTCDDVRGISSVCQSTSRGEPDRIGRFGIGFKSVYAYTRRPEIHSGDEHFCIEHYVRPQVAEPRYPDAGLTTLIALPFDASVVSPAVAKREIVQAFQRLDPTTLLFLRHVKAVEFSAEGVPAVSLDRRQTSHLSPWVRLVELGCSTNVANREKWLIFERSVELLDPSGRKVSSRVELAFELTPASSEAAFQIVAREQAAVAVFFPTEWKTATGFILQGPYVPTPARDNIRKNDPTNCLLAEESAKLLTDSLRWLRDRGALTVSVFNTLPLKRSDFPEETLLRPMFEHVLETIKAQPLLLAHTADSKPQVFVEGCKAVAPSSASLRDLLGDGLLAELMGDQSCRWLADGLTVKGTSDLSKYLREEVRVREISARDFVAWLGTKDAAWWKELDETWLARCYRYLHTQTVEHPALKKLLIVRLESGEHVAPTETSVFFPAENAYEKEELAPFLTQLPIVRQALIKDDKDKTIESFLRQMGVAPLVAFQFIQKYLIPRYANPKGITLQENRSHVRFLKRAFSRMSPEELKTAISELQQVPFLICHKASDPEPNYLEIPTKTYLPAAYTNDGALERFFQASPDTWFVDQGYISEGEDEKSWNSFLVQLGAAENPRVTETEERHRTDRKVDGLTAALSSILQESPETRAVLAIAIWSIACRLLPGDGNYSDYQWDQFLYGRQELFGPRGGYRATQAFDASFFAALRDSAWLPCVAGKLHKPGQLFEDTKYNRELLGDSVVYLHHSIALKTRKEEWLAGKLGIRRSPTKESVLSRMTALSRATAVTEQTGPLYEFLDRVRADVSLVFENNSLIFCPGPEPRWIKPSQAFWEDESTVFGSTRGYLRTTYPGLREFFARIGVAASAGPTDYARALLEIAAGDSTDESIRIRVCRICKRLGDRLEEGGDWRDEQGWQTVWNRLLQGEHWLGRRGDDHQFKALRQLVRMDNEHLAALFEGKLWFWPFPELTELACQQLGVVGCSSATCHFTPMEPGGVNERLSEWMTKHWALISAFLHSDRWKSTVRKNADAALARKPAVINSTRIAVTYELAGVTVEEPEGRSSFFDGESGTLWLAGNLDEDEAAEAIGDALQEYFGPEALREFVRDLFCKPKTKALEKWRKKGLIVAGPIGSPTEDPGSHHADEVEPSKPEGGRSNGFAGDQNAESNFSAGTSSEPEPTRQRDTIGREGEPSTATGGGIGKPTISGDVQPPRKADPPKTEPANLSPRTQGEQTREREEEQRNENSGVGREDAATTDAASDVGQALNDAFNKAGKTQIADDRPQSGEVRNPADRRQKTRENYSARKSREPSIVQRTTQRIVDIWDPKNKAVRDFLYEEYSGRCQICGETNRFPRRDGKAYFEAVYLIPHSGAAWTDEPGSVICLCALCSAKFQHGAIECSDIADQISSQKTAEEGGNGRPSIRAKLIGKPVAIDFSERHLIEVQELLQVAATGPKTVTAARSKSPETVGGIPQSNLVRCPHCHPSSGLVRRDRLQIHIERVHPASPNRRTPTVSFLQQPQTATNAVERVPRRESLTLARCRACQKPVVPGEDYCRIHL